MQICKVYTADIYKPIYSTPAHIYSDVSDLLAINKIFVILKTDLTRHSLKEWLSQFYFE